MSTHGFSGTHRAINGVFFQRDLSGLLNSITWSTSFLVYQTLSSGKKKFWRWDSVNTRSQWCESSEADKTLEITGKLMVGMNISVPIVAKLHVFKLMLSISHVSQNLNKQRLRHNKDGWLTRRCLGSVSWDL